MKKITVLIFGIILSAAAFGQNVKESLPAKAFKSKMEATPDAVLLDVRTSEEISKGVIPGAINIDFNSPDFAQKIGALDKTKTYFVYCAKGVRSNKAVDQMSEAGFVKLYSLENGFIGWQEKKLPMQTK